MDRKILKIFAGFLFTFLALLGTYLIFLAYPQPAFDFKYHQGNIRLYANHKLDFTWVNTIGEVQKRIKKSEGFDEQKDYQVFLCTDESIFQLISIFQPNAAGLNNTLMNGHSYIRTPDFENDQIMNKVGNPVLGKRSLSGTIAHEITHKMLLDAVGTMTYLSANPWMIEGYCDYIGMEAPDYQEQIRLKELYLRNDFLKVTDEYSLYQLAVDYYLNFGGFSLKELLKSDISRAKAIETWIHFFDQKEDN